MSSVLLLFGTAIITYGVLRSRMSALMGACLIFFVALVPLVMIMYYFMWKIVVTETTIKWSALFKKTRSYQISQVKRVLCYSSLADSGTVTWVLLQDGKWLKVSHWDENYKEFHKLLLRKCSIEWK